MSEQTTQYKAYGAAIIGLEADFEVPAENENPKEEATEALVRQFQELDDDQLRDAMVDLDEYAEIEEK